MIVHQIRNEIQSSIRSTPEFKKLTESALALDSISGDLLALQNKQEMNSQLSQQMLANFTALEGRVIDMENTSNELAALTSQVCLMNILNGISDATSGCIDIYGA